MLSTIWVWPADAAEPAGERLELGTEIVLDREFLGVIDSSVSRTANAPRLSPLSSNRASLHVPPSCSTAVIVIEATDFESLQRGLPPESHAIRIAPANLSRRTKLAIGQRSSVGFVRSVNATPAGHRDHLICLPRAQRVEPGGALEVDAPALLAIGNAAVAVLPGATVAPTSTVTPLPAPRSFTLPDAGVSLAVTRELDEFMSTRDVSSLRIAGCDEVFQPWDLPRGGRQVLDRLKYHYAFVPALLDDREPRLVLLYERADGSVGTLISDADIAEWLLDLKPLLKVNQRPSEVLQGPRIQSPGISASTRARALTRATEPPRSVAPSPTLSEPYGLGDIVTLNPAFAEALERVKRLADTDLSLLVLGESGTGKERLARAVHEASSRAKGPFFAINCSAIPDSLIESELFGHQKGAFTGTSASRDGAFRSADGGTLLLDEVGDAPVHVQLALLRAVEGRRVKPVGADKEFPVNVRVIAATSRDLTKLIDEQSFRSDLYFRLAEIEITLPPLRDRNVDVPQIASAILREIGCDRPLTQDAAAWLQQQPWPGNIRELRNALRRATFANPESSVIDAACFGSREVRSTDRDGVAVAINIEFSEQIRQIAEHLWHERSWPALPELSAYERRALQRAALLCLTSMHGRAAFPKALNTVWGSLFGERWASSENERGLRDLLRVLGYSGSDENARAMVLAAVG